MRVELIDKILVLLFAVFFALAAIGCNDNDSPTYPHGDQEYRIAAKVVRARGGTAIDNAQVIFRLDNDEAIAPTAPLAVAGATPRRGDCL